MNEKNDASELLGRKIFFLYPTAVVQNRIITQLIQQEYEVYVAKDKDALKRVLKKYPDSIVFADVGEKLNEKEWEAWIGGIRNAPETKNISIGIVTAVDDEKIMQKYLEGMRLPCGYAVVRFELEKTIAQIITALEAVNAKGRRKYIRATTENEINTTVNLPIFGDYVHGQIKDISVVGISCTLDGSPEIAKNTLFRDIQVKLQSSLLKVEGIVFGSRMEGHEKIYVILFTQRIDPDIRPKIRKYIQQNLQNKMDFELK